MSLDDFPRRDRNSELAEKAEAAIERSVVEAEQFVLQQRDRHDYGTDFQLEATQSGGVTNFRISVQLKATSQHANEDGSVSVSVARANLNYLLSQPHSIYVCYHIPTERLLVCLAEEVFRDAEHDGEGWRRQASLTVRFRIPFDSHFQSALRAKTVAASSIQRDDRLTWIATPPDQFPEQVVANVPTIAVPSSQEEAIQVLTSLIESGRDDVISKAFYQFAACFELDDRRMTYAYLAEINLAMRRKPFSQERVRAALSFLEKTRPDNSADVLYCRANGHSALREAEEAKRLYRASIAEALHDHPTLTAQCWKNLGSELELEGKHYDARECYERAIALAPNLMEAHFALAMSYRSVDDLNAALSHFDHVIWAVEEAESTLAARGYRLEAYFRLGQIDKAFDDIAVLLPHGERHRWILNWCARLVHIYAGGDGSSNSRAIRFWDALLRMRPTDRGAQRQRLLCLAYAKIHHEPVGIDYRQYVADVTAYLATDKEDAAFLWDRIGHWAQEDENWVEAEAQFRKSYSVEPGKYGYCLGVALNVLGRFEEALPILIEQGTTHHPDARSWFQVARAQEGVGDIASCKASYLKALSLDPEYDLALFNLGGIYWNCGQREEGLRVWSEAIERFPNHELAEVLRRDFGEHFQ